jgi:peptide-methionine (S)-S-oxide reductase
MNQPAPQNAQIALLGGGCFWCLEAVFDQLQGVSDVVSGYSGGRLPNPSYQQVCKGDTGHAEVVRVTFDPGVISFRDILEVFFAIHDPTMRDRQGNDVGPQYRSVIFYQDDKQREEAQSLIRQLDAAGLWAEPIVTEVAPAGEFYPAEDYHQEYFHRNGTQPYCQVVVAPKVAKFRKQFASRLKLL